MGKLLASLLNLQAVERQLAQVRRRLKSRQNAVNLQQKRIDQLQQDMDMLHARSMSRRKEADSLAVDLKAKEEQVARLRVSLNTAKTNKEYSAILTQINTFKADNAKVEDLALKAMQEVEQVKAECDSLQEKVDAEDKHMLEIRQASDAEIARLNAMLTETLERRSQAAAAVAPENMAIFSRIAATYDGEGMAAVEVHGRKAPYTYVCGGCYMNLNAEHANALRVRDEIRTCDNCGRILYLTSDVEKTATT